MEKRTNVPAAAVWNAETNEWEVFDKAVIRQRSHRRRHCVCEGRFRTLVQIKGQRKRPNQQEVA